MPRSLARRWDLSFIGVFLAASFMGCIFFAVPVSVVAVFCGDNTTSASTCVQVSRIALLVRDVEVSSFGGEIVVVGAPYMGLRCFCETA